jgi:hypothetical protein
MSKANRPLSTSALSALVLGAIAAIAISASATARTSAHAARTSSPPAHSASSYLVGLGDEQTEMFANPLWQQLHTRIARYIAPYDAAVHPDSLARARAWIAAAEAQHVQILVAFYHSEHTPTVLPSVAQYKHDVQKFVKLFPNVKQYQSYDEANRGNVRGAFSSPSASAAAQYYQALLRVCSHCTVIGLDVLDAQNIGPTLSYISEFKREIGKLRTVMPKIWGLHNYSDINRLESWRTREISHAMGGQIWLTETGGIVQFGGSFPNHHGSGLARAANVLKYMFGLAGSQSQIRRLYIYDWTGGVTSTRFDAGLMDAHDNPRMGYVVVCKQLHAKKCNVKVSSH